MSISVYSCLSLLVNLKQYFLFLAALLTFDNDAIPCHINQNFIIFSPSFSEFFIFRQFFRAVLKDCKIVFLLRQELMILLWMEKANGDSQLIIN